MEPLPTDVAEHIPFALDQINRILAPAPAEALAVLLQDLWDSDIPQPAAIFIKAWRKHLSQYPAEVISKAFDQLIKIHRWPTPPKIADVCALIEPEMEKLYRWRRKLYLAQAWLHRNRRQNDAELKLKHTQWEASLTDEQRERLHAIREAARDDVPENSELRMAE